MFTSNQSPAPNDVASKAKLPKKFVSLTKSKQFLITNQNSEMMSIPNFNFQKTAKPIAGNLLESNSVYSSSSLEQLPIIEVPASEIQIT